MRSRPLSCAFVSSLVLAACGGNQDRNDDLVTGADRLTQNDIARIASSIQVTFEVVANVPDDCPANAPAALCLDGKIRLKNTGSDLNAGGWTIYYSSIRKILTTASSEFTISFINGDLHKIELAPGFTGFKAGETKEIPFQAEFWMMSESDFMPRAYVTGPGLTPASVANTDTEDFTAFVAPLVTPLQTRRHPIDQSVIATAGTRFAENSGVRDLGAAGVASEVVPTPQNMTNGIGILNLQPGLKISASGIGAEAVASFKARLAQLGVRSNDVDGTPVYVSVDPNHAAFAGKSTKEAYTLKVDDVAVTIVGGDAAGASWGLQTMAGLLPGDVAINKRLPQVTIAYDPPRYAYRGVQLDLSRNFHGRGEVVKVLDQMASYKLNTLHMHLGDDEGWRLEIPGLPELTSLGAKRCHDLEDKVCLMAQLGSGPSTNTAGTGYLTRADFVQIVRAAQARNIEVIPEFDMPGHARAAIKAMEARARAGDMTYRLADPDDTSKYSTNQNYTDNAINACMESPYAFVAKVMDEVKAMYAEAGVPLKTWHIGGDEVGGGAWTASPICNALYAAGGEVKSVNDVHGYFMRRVNSLAQARGFGVRGWSDGMRKSVVAPDGSVSKVFLDPGSDLNNNAASANWWGTLFWWDDSVYALANAGYKVILTSPDYLYFDHPYEADPKERGYYWATRYTNLRKLFFYISGNLPANSQISKDRMGGDFTSAVSNVLGLTKPENIIGLEGPQWGETMRTDDQVDYMVFPRLLALAERAWHRGAWEPVDGTDYRATIDMAKLAADWERFANTVGYKELPKLDKSGVRYRVEVPGGQIQNGTLAANVATPGLTIQYKDTRGNWQTYDARRPPSVTSTEIRAVASDGRAGRSVSVP